MSNLLFVLGAGDPEMQAIENLLKECGVPFAYAVGPDGRRVHPGNAYKAESFDAENTENFTIVEVECSVFPKAPNVKYVTVDHHRDGDPGYGKSPSEYFSASSIGQVISLLATRGICPWPLAHDIGTVGSAGTLSACNDGTHWITVAAACHYDFPMAKIPHDIVLTAAADHCLAAAYRGECPGVNPDELMKWRIESRAKFQNRSAEEVLADIESARKILRDGIPNWDDPWFLGAVDLRGQSIPELPEAAAREGVAFLATVTDRDGREKVVIGGHTTPELVKEFMGGKIVPGLVDYYGDPARGFAGGYVK